MKGMGGMKKVKTMDHRWTPANSSEGDFRVVGREGSAKQQDTRPAGVSCCLTLYDYKATVFLEPT